MAQQYLALTNDGVNRRFGNHRKYETLRPDSARGTSRVVQSYVAWVGANRGHGLLVDDARQAVGPNPRAVFDHLYRSMDGVTSFGRTGRFDFLAMVGKLGLADIEPGIPYLKGATGPLLGAKLLFGGAKTVAIDPATLDVWSAELGDHLEVGMQAIEDGMCNWQKSPDSFISFRG
jgi:Alpha-glutamyl/putrescinyl thymine pyrophosphorylase clade 3